MDLAECIQVAKDLEEASRRARVRNFNRIKTYVLFIDLKKAFDKVPRRRLVDKLLTQGFRPSLVQTIHNIL